MWRFDEDGFYISRKETITILKSDQTEAIRIFIRAIKSLPILLWGQCITYIVRHIIKIVEVSKLKGIKLCLLGIALVLIGGFFVVSDKASLNGLEAVLFIAGVTLCITGCSIHD